MQIHQSPFSYNARKALMTAAHLGLAVDVVNVELAKGEQRKPEFLALNPNGKVPVLVDGDFVLPESQAIMIYLAEKTAGQNVYPSDLRTRADIHRWMFWSSNHWGPAISTLNFERVVKKILGQGDPDPAQIARGEALFNAFATVLDAHLAKREWLVGQDVTLADIAVGCPLMVAASAQVPLAPYSNIQRWFTRFQALDAWKKVTG